jgi:hypothetical protein
MRKYLDAHPAVDMVTSDMDLINERGDLVGTLGSRYKRCILELGYYCNIGASFMYRLSTAERIGKYDEAAFCAEDYDYFLRISINGNIAYINDNLYQYREHNLSLTSNNTRRIRKMADEIRNRHMPRFVKRYGKEWWKTSKCLHLSRVRLLSTSFVKYYPACFMLLIWRRSIKLWAWIALDKNKRVAFIKKYGPSL